MVKKKLLLVDNNTSDQSHYMCKIFGESGLHVRITDNGRAALEEICKNHYDLVIIDFNIPQIGGLGLLKKIKEVNKCLPVIVMSAKAGVKDAVEAMKLGAEDFLLKPLTNEMIGALNSRISNSLASTDEDLPEDKYTIVTQNR